MGKRGKKGGEEMNGGEEGRKGHQMLSGEQARPEYPTGPTLNAMEKRIGYPHRPLGRDGEVMGYNFSAHSGCAERQLFVRTPVED